MTFESFSARSCAVDFQTESVLALNKKTKIQLEISVFYFVPKHFRSETHLHMIRSKCLILVSFETIAFIKKQQPLFLHFLSNLMAFQSCFGVLCVLLAVHTPI